MKNAAQQYVANQVLTAPKEDLLLMLFDGAVRFIDQAGAKVEAKDIEGSSRLFIRAQRIVIELMGSLRRDVLGDEMHDNLMKLYRFVYVRLVDANVKQSSELGGEARRIMAHLRQTWSMAIDKDRKEKYPQLALIEKAQKAHNRIPPPSDPRGPINVEG